MIAAAANSAWLLGNIPSWLRFTRALDDPASTQLRILQSLMSQNASTAYGRAHGFNDIRAYQQFRARVPVIDYDAVHPWITRIMKGEESVLCHEPVTRLVPTSGSTGGRKLIPFTRGLQQQFNAAIGPWITDLYRTEPALALGPAYWSISPLIASPEEHSTVPIGFDDDSAYLGGIRQRLVEAALAVPSVLRQVKDVQIFRYLTCLHLLRCRDLRLFSVWHPSFFTLLLDALAPNWDQLLVDLKTGGCAYAASLPDQVRTATAARPMPERAREVATIGVGNPLALWPHLRVISCWGDGHAGLALADLERRFPGVRLQPKGLLATEGSVSIPFQGQHPIAVTSHFYEFETSAGDIRLCHELELGKTYTVLITTAGGLWRYRLGDQVQVSGFLGRTPSLRFLSRGSSVSDLAGEKLTESFVTAAITSACRTLATVPAFAMLAPESANGTWHYTLFLDAQVSHETLDRLEGELRQNPHYALCRDLGQLGPLQCVELAEARGYELFAAALLAQGQRLGDIKPTSLSQRTDWRVRFSNLSNR